MSVKRQNHIILQRTEGGTQKTSWSFTLSAQIFDKRQFKSVQIYFGGKVSLEKKCLARGLLNS